MTKLCLQLNPLVEGAEKYWIKQNIHPFTRFLGVVHSHIRISQHFFRTTAILRIKRDTDTHRHLQITFVNPERLFKARNNS
ncbi:hypothetical protein D3C77_440780 [compost metagenome]